MPTSEKVKTRRDNVYDAYCAYIEKVPGNYDEAAAQVLIKLIRTAIKKAAPGLQNERNIGHIIDETIKQFTRNAIGKR